MGIEKLKKKLKLIFFHGHIESSELESKKFKYDDDIYYSKLCLLHYVLPS